ncbi:MAG: penicillin-binding protein 2 [Candidatus Magasanikbacteria bacterium]|nr:penicillin-binding protein 2 [Candidatus Magasanikbacteria bacterium]
MRRFWFWGRRPSRDLNPFVIQEGRILKDTIKEVSRENWVESAWTGEGKGGLFSAMPEFLGVAVSSRRVKILGGLILFGLLLLFVRAAHLQLIKGGYYRALAEENRLRYKPILSERGLFFDRNLKQLVTNTPSFNLVFAPQDLPKDQEKMADVLEKISSLSGLPVGEVKKQLGLGKKSPLQNVVLVENIDYEKSLRLMLEGAEVPGLNLEQNFIRSYSFSPGVASAATSSLPTSAQSTVSSLSHILGYLGKLSEEEKEFSADYLPADNIGKTGLEKSYERILRGVYGERAIEVDAGGKERKVVRIKSPQAGKNLVLSLDMNFQKKLEEILKRELRAAGKTRAAAVALDPRNGEILALVSLPAYDNNLFAQGITAEEYQKLLIDSDAPLFSRAWSGQYPSGSTIKPLLAAAALDEGIITKQTTVLSTGGLAVDRWFFPDWKAGGHGSTNVVKALAESVNTFFYYLGGGYQNFKGLGLEKMILYLKKFGLGNILGVDLPNEAAGFLPTKEWKESTKGEKWYIGDTYNLSIGQGDLLITPLQLAVATAAIANGGALYRPHLVKTVVDPISGSKEEIAPRLLDRQVVPEIFLATIREGMREAIKSGSALSLADLGIKVAGKTGTAEWSKKHSPHAWFTSFAPFDNPSLVLTILVEEGGEGSGIAASVARAFYRWWPVYSQSIP